MNRRFPIIWLWTLLIPATVCADDAGGTRPLEDHAPFDAPAAMLLTAPGAEDTSGHGVEILLDESHIHFDENGIQTARYHMIYRILTHGGADDWDRLSAWWSPWRQQRPELRGRVVTPDSAEHWVDSSTIAEQKSSGDDDVISNRLQLVAPLPAVTVGAVVETERVYRDLGSPFQDGDNVTHYIGWRLPTQKVRIVAEAPAGLPLRWRVREMPGLEPAETVASGMRRLVFEAGPLEPVEAWEPYLPGDIAGRPMLEISTGESWRSIARTYDDILEQQIRQDDLSAQVREVLGEIGNRKEKIDRLLAWVQNEVRYTGLELDEAAIVPRPPTETLRRGYGDCKDKAALLVALLRAAGIPAHVALLRVGTARDLNPDLPGLGIFDHAIVYVPGEPEIWIDPTSRYSRAGELPPADRGRLALVVSPQSSMPIRTPDSTAADNVQTQDFEIFLAELGKGRIAETIHSTGAHELSYRQSMELLEPSHLEEVFRATIEAQDEEARLDDFASTESEALDVPFEIRMESSNRRSVATELADAAVALSVSDQWGEELPEILLEDSDDDEPRRKDLLLPFPMTLETRCRIHPPPGFTPISLPEQQQRMLGPASYSLEVSTHEDGSLLLFSRFATGNRRWTPDDLAAFRAAVQEVMDDDPLLLKFEHGGERSLAAGKLKEALEQFRAAVSATPDRALPRTRLARGLLAAGLGAAARNEARRAVEMEPESAAAHRFEGLVLSHDLLGRKFRQGADLEAAERAFRKALDLDPDDWQSRAELAILLEHDGEGWRYGPQARLDEAIAEYRVLRDAGHGSMDPNLLVALTRAERFEEARALADEIPSSTLVKTLKIATSAVLDGPDVAIREALRSSFPQELGSLFANAAQNIVVLRRYGVAAEVLTAAARHQQNAVPVFAQAARLAEMGRFETTEMPEDDPRTAVLRTAIAQYSGESIEPTLSRRVRGTQLAEAEIEKALMAASVILDQTLSSGSSRQVLLDSVAGNLEITLDGERELGFRAQVLAANAPNALKEIYFAVPEDGTYRLLSCATGSISSLGIMALEHLEQNDLDGARKWLDWAREGIPSKSADDSLSGHVLSHFWHQGQEGSAAEIRAAAAALLALGSGPRKAVQILESGKPEATEDQGEAFDLALAMAYHQLEDFDRALLRLEGLRARYPDSERALGMTMVNLLRSGRQAELEATIREVLAREPRHRLALVMLASLEASRGRLAEANESYRRIITNGDGTGDVYNNLAWNALILGDPQGDALGTALRAAETDSDAAALHTLAVAYAEKEQPGKALQVILESMKARGQEEPGSDDWYVLGRIAETYGLSEAALDAYAKVEPPESPEESPYNTTSVLAEKRIAMLRTPKAARF